MIEEAFKHDWITVFFYYSGVFGWAIALGLLVFWCGNGFRWKQ